MNNKNKIKNLSNKLIFLFLILIQTSNTLLIVDLLDYQDKIALNSDADNSAKEDKNTLDSLEESKIFCNYFHYIYFSNELKNIDYTAQNLNEVLNPKDLPPPELNSL